MNNNLYLKKIKFLKNEIEDLKNMLNYKLYNNEIIKINNKLKEKNTFKKYNEIISLNNKKKNIINNLELFNKFEVTLLEVNNLINIYNKFKENLVNLSILEKIYIMEEKVNELKCTYFFTNKNDNKDCYVNINSGSGGTESKDWNDILLRMYIKWSENKQLKYKILNNNLNLNKKHKSINLLITGKYAYGWFKTETGIHRLVRKNPFNSGKRHTSFSSVYVYPKINDNLHIKINHSDFKVDVYKSSGSGGQHVNKTESAVRITHIPTGIITKCQSNRSQFSNKNKAIKQLNSKLNDLKLLNKKINNKILDESKLDISWGNQIRSYILDDSLIKDLRTKIETSDIKSVLNGNLHVFIEESLKLKLYKDNIDV